MEEEGMTDYRKAMDNLLSAAMTLSPTGLEQAGFTKLVNDMGLAGERPSAIVKALIKALDDATRGTYHPVCPDHFEYLEQGGHIAAPGVGFMRPCPRGHAWVALGGEWYRAEDEAHILSPEDVR